jgi:hypothetical protein
MAFEGGIIPTLGITPSFITELATNAATAGATQVYQGAGQSFLTQAGQALVGNLAGSAVNVAMNSFLGSDITGVSGIPLTSGGNILASTITPYITGNLAAGINQTIQQSLGSAGAFGPVLSQLGTGLVNQVFGGLSNIIGGLQSANGGGGWGKKTFPGAGDEPPASYGDGSPYSLGSNGSDVVFTIQPANQGVQRFGISNSVDTPASAVTQAFGQFGGSVPDIAGIDYSTFITDKVTSMGLTDFFGQAAADLVLPDSFKDLFGSDLGGPSSVFGDQQAWTFITAPKNISWETANQVNRVDIFGTNQPPVVSGTRGMRDFTMSEALVEGFVRNVTVEGKISALENLLNYALNQRDGFVNVPVYQVTANEKKYGANGYFIIKSVKVNEMMRDLKGDATRAMVDISFIQVPEYQVGSGRDQASNKTANTKFPKSLQDTTNQGVDKNKAPNGPNAPKPAPKPSANPPLRPEPLWDTGPALRPTGPALRPEPLWDTGPALRPEPLF